MFQTILRSDDLSNNSRLGFGPLPKQIKFATIVAHDLQLIDFVTRPMPVILFLLSLLKEEETPILVVNIANIGLSAG